MKLSKYLLLLAIFFSLNPVKAAYLSWSELERKFKQENLNTKALGHIKCFFEKHENTVFQKKISNAPGTENRCSGDPNITLDKKRIFALIDYTAPSSDQRMLLVDRQTGDISKMAVAHGRFKAGMFNRLLSANNNSVRNALYFSNELGSNAPSSGFFLAGTEYQGKFGRSLVIHGLENGINDNACERTVVIHKHTLVTKTSAHIQSSGCPMVSKSYIDHIINLLQGSLNSDNGDESNGSVIFIYGPRESKWIDGSCDGNFNV